MKREQDQLFNMNTKSTGKQFLMFQIYIKYCEWTRYRLFLAAQAVIISETADDKSAAACYLQCSLFYK